MAVSSYIPQRNGRVYPSIFNSNWNYYNSINGPISEVKQITIGGVKLKICKYSNYKISVQDLVTSFKNTDKGTEVEFNAGSEVFFSSIDEAKAFINKFRGQIKKMQSFGKQCSMDGDFV